jgi:hypothetical protein
MVRRVLGVIGDIVMGSARMDLSRSRHIALVGVAATHTRRSLLASSGGFVDEIDW